MTQPEQVTLSDGRRVSVRQFGAADGSPVLILDGAGSRVFARLLDAAAADAGARLVAPDRPGFGDSDPRPRRTILDWADDATAVADHLELDRFAVLGISGGTPFAIATAARLPDRVTRLGILGGVSPLDDRVFTGASSATKKGYTVGRRVPVLMHGAFSRLGRQARRNPDRAIGRLFATRPEDAHVLDDPDTMAVLRDEFPVMFAHPRENAREFRLMARSWGVEPEEVRAPTFLWYGGADTVHPPAMGRLLAERIPDATLSVRPDVGTFRLLDDAHEHLQALIS
jgi:pimeloyl-ACP methyl ester carboxylesterase